MTDDSSLTPEQQNVIEAVKVLRKYFGAGDTSVAIHVRPLTTFTSAVDTLERSERRSLEDVIDEVSNDFHVRPAPGLIAALANAIHEAGYIHKDEL